MQRAWPFRVTAIVARGGASRNGEIGRMNAETTAIYPLAGRAGATSDARYRAVREEDEYYIPDFTTADPFRSRPRVYAAANEHARSLRDAGQQLDEAFNLARVLRCSVQGEDDSRAMQADTVLKIVEQKLSRARHLVDRHDAVHLNLFMAYFDLRDRLDDSATD